jgi:hypothetical protein
MSTAPLVANSGDFGSGRVVEQLLSGDADCLQRTVTLGGELVGAAQRLGGLDLENRHRGPVDPSGLGVSPRAVP